MFRPQPRSGRHLLAGAVREKVSDEPRRACGMAGVAGRRASSAIGAGSDKQLEVPGGRQREPQDIHSYSRVDGVLVERLCADLIARGFGAYFDRKEIVPGEKWRDRLDALILGADVVVFLISPNSVDRWDQPPPQESICAWEIRRTRELGKRLIAVKFRSGPGITVPPDLSSLHYVDATGIGRRYAAVAGAFKIQRDGALADFPEAHFHRLHMQFVDAVEEFNRWLARSRAIEPVLDELIAAINLEDVHWLRQHSRWVTRATEWEASDATARDGRLLPAGEIAELRALMSLRSPGGIEFPKVVTDLLARSAEHRDRELIARSRTIGRAFVKPAEQALSAGQHDHALRLAATGALLADDLACRLVPELWRPAARAIFESRVRVVLHPNAGRLRAASFSTDGRSAVTVPFTRAPPSGARRVETSLHG